MVGNYILRRDNYSNMDAVENKSLPLLHTKQTFGESNFIGGPSTSVDEQRGLENCDRINKALPEKQNSKTIATEEQSNPSKVHKSSASDQRQSTSDDDVRKQTIKNHPLFAAVEYMFEKCEEATYSLGAGRINKTDLETLLRRQLEVHGSLFSNDKDLDNFLLKTIQHLRFQHHELKKVDELCDNFLERYLGCLKTKITQETLLGWSDGDSDSCSPPEPSGANAASAPVATIQTPSGPVSVTLFDGGGNASAAVLMDKKYSALKQIAPRPLTFVPTLPSANNAASSLQTNEGEIPCLIISTSAGLPATGFNISNNNNNNNNNSINLNSFAFDMDSGDNGDGGSTNSMGKPKRGSLPRRSTDILRSWLYQHFAHPYPSEEEKLHLSKESGLKLIQVNNWFINARRRILQPLLAGNERTSTSPKNNESSSNNNASSVGDGAMNLVMDGGSLKRSSSSSSSSSRSKAISLNAASKHWPEASVVELQQRRDEITRENDSKTSKKRRRKRKILEKLDFSDHETSDDEPTTNNNNNNSTVAAAEIDTLAVLPPPATSEETCNSDV